MEQIPVYNTHSPQCRHMMQWTLPGEKTPMHPDDYSALHAWITARRFHETVTEGGMDERRVFPWVIG